MMTDKPRAFVIGLAIWLFLSTAVIRVAVSRSRVASAVLDMGIGVILLWIVVGGLLMVRFRDPIARYVQGLRGDWRVKFVLFATLLALVEEAITTALTNMAPLFGVRIGQAYITASTNYWDVVGLHSVVIFVSLFVGWAWLLSRYDFSPFAVFVLFGLTGTLAETSTGPQHLREFGFWIFVYGLMVYLPACSLPVRPGARPPRPWHYALAVFAPFVFLILFPLGFVVHLFFPHHPNVHFPPIRG